MEIKPVYITFEQAKLLKEKRFNEVCKSWYVRDTLAFSSSLECNSKLKECEYSRSEQWQVIEWLRVKHGIIVCSLPDNEDDFITTQRVIYKPAIYSVAKGLHNLYRELVVDNNGNAIEFFDTPQEAYSSAFDYILNKLI